MKKFFNLALFTMILSLILPIGVTNVLADGDTYDANTIQDGNYDVTAKAMHATEDKKSGAQGFINKEATLSIQDGQARLSITVPNNEMATIKGIQVEGLEAQVKKSDKAKTMTFALPELKSELDSQVQYEVPSMDIDHDVPLRFILEGLGELPKKEAEKPDSDKEDKEKPTVAPEEREVGKLLTQKEADAVYELEYGTDSKATAGQLENPVKLLEKGNKKYIQIPVKENGAPLFRSLKIDGKEVTWNSITEGPYTIQFELNNGIEEKLDLSMVIQAGPNAMPHGDIKVWFDKDSLKPIKESNNEEENVDKPNDNPGKNEKPNKNEDKKEQQNNKQDKDKDNNKVNKGDKKKDEKDSKQEENALVPDKAYEVDYVIKHASEDQASAADSFFKKPGYLFEKDGVNYVQLTVTNSDMIDKLKTANGDVIIVKKNSDGSMVVQFKVGNDLSEAVLLSMHITVPGMYSMEHDARLFLDKNSLKEINPEKHELTAADNGNGPDVKDGKKGQTLGGDSDDKDNNGTGSAGTKGNNGSDNTGKRVHSDTPVKPDLSSDKDGAASKGDKAQNPQTGDTSSILLYSLLLIGAFIPLARKFKGRFI